ncbi:hypothetical protein BC936DRAFT_147550 [Jimgerdemannia flammicorona]|uniref:Uncharacterized protein n=1 Tax=Jimgerdemannia flammicorona TaxID=994334 RepID=A0A433DL47_9FUNG|nr:hypothetical protein BC936DRAFT_147550 [Jimgerdemannia flammicorona]
MAFFVQPSHSSYMDQNGSAQLGSANHDTSVTQESDSQAADTSSPASSLELVVEMTPQDWEDVEECFRNNARESLDFTWPEPGEEKQEEEEEEEEEEMEEGEVNDEGDEEEGNIFQNGVLMLREF